MNVIARLSAPLLMAATLLISTAAAHAQQAAPAAKGPPNALQGFSQNRDLPVHIESATLEVRDKDKMATFSGDVRVKQGDTGMRSQTLKVFYEGGESATGGKATPAAPAGKSMPAAQPGPGGEQKIKRLEAHGAVVVTQKDQTATGDLGIFDMKANTVTLTGTVMMTQGKNVLRGEKLVVDLTTGVSRVESGKGGTGRVQGLFLPGSQTPDAAAKPDNKPDNKPGAPAPAQGSGTLRSPVPLKPFN
jgi:lipopolysaccharide export system protein LptA